MHLFSSACQPFIFSQKLQLHTMVSYKRLTPEEVHFSGVPLLQSHDDSQDSELKVEDAEHPCWPGGLTAPSLLPC
ncbi:hypothetical protein PHYPO_G00149770 [Pangasianodon hypophthalmus]|uniref:Uncharacterized protein n=1 Tax=Pangasianodon hypophthalmus TaxID=310915 RepID=A0A5N5K800_PANHP|nr:hypothetical protein PHYPO_G00149770 [Pangasianodon hypophthalmus]